MPTIRNFEELDVWKDAISLCTEIYALTLKKEFERDYGMKDQLRRASVSISNNIAEGFEYNNNNHFLKYLKISKGSCGEIRNMIIILHEIKYITPEEKKYFYDKSNLISYKLGRLIKYLQQNKIEKTNKTITPNT